MIRRSSRSAQRCRRAVLGVACLLVAALGPAGADAAAHLSLVTHETLHVVVLARTVYGGRTTPCPAHMLVHYTVVRGCEEVVITTEPGSKILLTLRYRPNKHYLLHKTVYANARAEGL